MKSSRLRHRLAGTAAVTVLVGAGALAAAPSAVAKANVLTINKVAMRAPDIQVKVTYSCDPGMNHQLVANAIEINQPGPEEPVAAGIIKTDKLTCDYDNHAAQITMRTLGTPFDKGEKVKVAVFYFDDDGFSYARQETVVVL
ncbi:hypothetical protein WKI65_30105 [Streptomyces sp. MS1.AVA.3]|uniref:hypothetical protein n=1 Tax=Streptomyces decoyicus TaxID=249567 RepID=UPI0030C5EE63